MTSVAHYDDQLVVDSNSEFHAHPEFGVPVSYEFRRESGFLGSGFLSGALLIIFLIWYRGGPGALRPITSLFDPSTQPGEYDPSRGGQYPPPRSSSSTSTYRVAVQNANLRACPGLDCEVITSLQVGTTVTDLRESQSADGVQWLRVSAAGREGWVARSLLENAGTAGINSTFGRSGSSQGSNVPTTLRVRVSGLRMRECPGYNCAEIESLPVGTTITYLNQESIVDSERWYKVRYRSLDGWVSRQDLE